MAEDVKIIETLTRDMLLELAGRDYDACISVYMPVVRTGPETRQNRIRFKALCAQAEAKLAEYSVDKRRAARLMDRLRGLGDDPAFTEKREDGVAAFAAPDMLIFYRAPEEFAPQAVVDRRFYIRPLLPLLDRGEKLRVVLLNRGGARLLECDARACAARLPPHHLQSLDNFLAAYEFTRVLQHYRYSPGAGGRSASSYHGQGTPGDEAVRNVYIKDYYRQFKNWLAGETGDDRPLYVAGDARNTGFFIEVMGGEARRVVPLIQRNISDLDDADIHAGVLAELARRREAEEDAQRARLMRSESEDAAHTVHAPDQIVAAALEKRIDTLFLPGNDNQVWGRFDARQRKAVAAGAAATAGEELFNLAAIRTLQNGGRVVTQRDGGGAAICRW